MIPGRNHADVLSRKEKQAIHRNVLRTLAEVGLQVEHGEILDLLRERGCPVDADKQRVFFPEDMVAAFLHVCPRTNWARRVPQVSGFLGVYSGRYHDPETGRLEPWTEARLAAFLGLARLLPEVEGSELLGCPLDVRAETVPLYERLYAWRHGVRPGGTLHPFSTTPALTDLLQAYACMRGQEVKEVFTGVCYLISPLRWAAEECRQFWHWYRQGLRVTVGSMPTGGASAGGSKHT